MFDPSVLKVIKLLVLKNWQRLAPLVGTWEDLFQELLLHCWKRMPSYNPARASLPTFVDRIARNKIASMTGDMLRQKRDWRRCMSLTNLGTDRMRDEDDHVVHKHAWNQHLHRTDQHHLRIDVRRVVAGLPPDLGALARAVMSADQRSDVVRELGASRATVHRRMGRLRSAFEAAGFDSYLRRTDVRSSSSRRRAREEANA